MVRDYYNIKVKMKGFNELNYWKEKQDDWLVSEGLYIVDFIAVVMWCWWSDFDYEDDLEL